MADSSGESAPAAAVSSRPVRPIGKARPVWRQMQGIPSRREDGASPGHARQSGSCENKRRSQHGGSIPGPTIPKNGFTPGGRLVETCRQTLPPPKPVPPRQCAPRSATRSASNVPHPAGIPARRRDGPPVSHPRGVATEPPHPSTRRSAPQSPGGVPFARVNRGPEVPLRPSLSPISDSTHPIAHPILEPLSEPLHLFFFFY